MDATGTSLDDAIRALRLVAETYLTDECGNLRHRWPAGLAVLGFLDAAGELETVKLKDHLGREISRQLRLKQRP